MSILPLSLSDPWEALRPSRILDQHFGLGLEPEYLLSPLTYPISSRFVAPRFPTSYYRPWCSAAATGDAGSFIKMDKDRYQVNLDVQQFAPNEINVKVSGNNVITVEGRHDEKQDEHGFISRHFVRKYLLPEGHDINKIMSSLSSDGVLSITVPRVDQTIEQEHTIPIQQTGVPSKATMNEKQEELVCPRKEATMNEKQEELICPRKE